MRLRLVTYNVHRGRGADRVLDMDRIARVLRHHEPDIACIQEVSYLGTEDPDASQARILAEAASLPYGAVALNCIRRRGVYGNATLSRFPLEDAENLDLSLPLQIARGGLHTKVRLPGGRCLHVLNVHLGFAGPEQRRQIRIAAEHLDSVAGGSSAGAAPTVLAGDMNDWRHRIAPTVAAKAGFRPALGDASEAGPATFPSRRPLGALDKVFVRGPVRVLRAHVSRLALARDASDHLPVITEIEIGP